MYYCNVVQPNCIVHECYQINLSNFEPIDCHRATFVTGHNTFCPFITRSLYNDEDQYDRRLLKN